MASLQIEVPPSVEPVTLKAVKSWLRVDSDFTDDDDTINGLITSARELVEGFTGRSLIRKKYIQTLDSFPYYVDTVMSQMAYPPSYYSLPRYSTTLWNYSQMIKVLMSPLVSVDRITYRRAADAQFHSLVPATSLWQPGISYALGAKARDVNNNVQLAGGPGTSSDNPPTWNTNIGETTVDNDITWTNEGPSPDDPFLPDTQSEPGRIFPGPSAGGASLGFWPSVLYVPNAVQIHFTAGHADNQAGILASGRQGMVTAMMMLIAGWHEHREAMTALNLREIPSHVKDLLWMHKIYDLQPTRG